MDGITNPCQVGWQHAKIEEWTKVWKVTRTGVSSVGVLHHSKWNLCVLRQLFDQSVRLAAVFPLVSQ